MEVVVKGLPKTFLVFVITLNDEVLITKEVSDSLRLCMGNYSNVSPEAL